MSAMSLKLTTKITAVLTVAIIGFGAVATPANASSRWTNMGGGYWLHDADGNGRAEEGWVYTDGDNNVDYAFYDTNQDGEFDWLWERVGFSGAGIWVNTTGYSGYMLYADMNGDGRYESVMYDENRDWKFEWKMVDTDGDGRADSEWQKRASRTSGERDVDRAMADATTRNLMYSSINSSTRIFDNGD